MEAAINRVPEKDDQFVTNPSASLQQPSRVASGKIRQVRFLDAEVAYWQTAGQHYMVNGTTTEAPTASTMHALDGTRCAASKQAAMIWVCSQQNSSSRQWAAAATSLDGRMLFLLCA